METIQAILTRRSIRQYTGQMVDEALVDTLLRAGMYAPSAHNHQPWHFIVINDRQKLLGIADFHPYAAMLRQAPLAITVCGDLKSESSIPYLALDCAAATQNILLAAHSSGLGAVWLGIYPREERMQKLKQLLWLPQNIIPVSLISIGFPAETKDQPQRFNRQCIHYNIW